MPAGNGLGWARGSICRNGRLARILRIDCCTTAMASRTFSIWIVTTPGYPHSRCFEEVALSLQAAFADLGFDAPVVTDPALVRGRAVVLGANLLPVIKV